MHYFFHNKPKLSLDLRDLCIIFRSVIVIWGRGSIIRLSISASVIFSISWRSMTYGPELLAHTQFGPTFTLAPCILRPMAHFGLRHISAQEILRPNAYFSPKQLRLKTTLAKYTLAQGPNSQKCNF